MKIIVILLAASLCACGSGSQGSNAGPAAADLGATCEVSTDCHSGVCLELVSNDQNVRGLCSALCQAPSGCGNSGVCLAETMLGQSACFRSCGSAADCAQGVPCVWERTVDAGVCSAVPSSVCNSLAAQGTCAACLGTSCCAQLKGCAEDVACSKFEESCPGICMAPRQGAADDQAIDAFSACAATSCSAQCQ